MEFVKCSLFNAKNKERNSKLYKKNKKIYLEAASWCAMDKYIDMDKFLSVSYISKEYPRTFQTDGLIFNTKQRPKYWCPINTLKLHIKLETIVTIILENGDNFQNLKEIISNKIKQTLTFFCKSKKEFDKKFPNRERVLEEFKKIEVEQQGKLRSRVKYVERYNEILFDKDIEIEPLAIFYFEDSKTDLREKLKPIKENVIGLPIYNTAYDRVAKRRPWGKIDDSFFD
jgi:hypothetical protein